jgi:hypothetical protein
MESKTVKGENGFEELSLADEEKIVNEIFSRNDGNSPRNKDSGFRDILKNGKPDISASPIFIKKVSL